MEFKNKKRANHTEIYEELLKEVQKHFNDQEILLIKKAYLMAKDLHRGQKRNSGEPYIIHPVYVAYILLTEMHLYDVDSIIAALLHDTMEDCGINFEFLESHFNLNVAKLVEGVSKLKKAQFSTREEREEYNNYLLLKSILDDYREIYIKLADRLHNMRTLDYKTETKRREKSAETLRFFVPLAVHVGANTVKNELADTSFKYLSKRNYREIKGMKEDYLVKHLCIIEEILGYLKCLLTDREIDLDVRPHVMNNFAIYQGLNQNKKISLLPNLISFDITADTEEEIRIIEKRIKAKFNVMEEYTRDFINHPRNNGYQALHLSIRGHKGIPYQIRIFTPQMALVNNFGFAALLQLNPTKTIEEIQRELIKDNEFFQVLSKNSQRYNKPFDLIDKSVRELLSDKIKVYVANGAEYYLPSTSTVADLADKIHSKLKHEAVGALVNGVEVNLSFPLKENDQVIILTKEYSSKLSVKEESEKLILEK